MASVARAVWKQDLKLTEALLRYNKIVRRYLTISSEGPSLIYPVAFERDLGSNKRLWFQRQMELENVKGEQGVCRTGGALVPIGNRFPSKNNTEVRGPAKVAEELAQGWMNTFSSGPPLDLTEVDQFAAN